MSNKIYVGNLSFSVTSESLSQAFSQFGTVNSSKVVTDRDTGRSKGFGFIEMSSDAEATQAISKLHGSSFEGRSMNVSEAKPMTPKAHF